MIDIVIADDHAIVREGLKRIIDDTPGMQVVAETGHGQELLDLIRTIEADVVMLDITMPGISGIDALKLLRSEFPALPVLILSMHPEDQYAIRVLRHGASGYLNKESAPEQLVSAIEKVVRGGKYITPTIAERLAENLQTSVLDKEPHELLSDREYQVMCHIAKGKSYNEIALELSLSVKTISTYRSRIIEKLKMKSNAEIIRYALQKNLA